MFSALRRRVLHRCAISLATTVVAIAHRPEEGVVEVSSATAHYRLPTLTAEDFPRLPEPGAGPLFAPDAPALATTAGRVSRSASRVAKAAQERRNARSIAHIDATAPVH